MLRTALLVSLGFVAAQGCRSAIDLIKEGEGYRSCMYRDTRGFRTICYGFNLDASGASSKVAGVGGNFNSVLSGSQCLSQTQCTSLLTSEVTAASNAARNIFGNVCPCIMNVLTDLTYNLGSAGIQQFRNFMAAIKAQNWRDASYHLSDSQYCRQVGNRCTRNRQIIERGCNGFFLFAEQDAQETEVSPIDVAMQVAEIADQVAADAELAAAGAEEADYETEEEVQEAGFEGAYEEELVPASEYEFEGQEGMEVQPSELILKKLKKVASKVKKGYDTYKKVRSIIG